MKRDTKTMYATMAPWRLFFVVALPGMISMFTMSIYSIIEGVFIGQKLGEAALAAVNIALPVVMINFSLADMVGVGSSAPISIALGQKDDKTANNYFSCAMLLILGVSVAMGCLMFFAAEPLVRLMGAEESVVGTATRYTRTYAVFSPLTTVFFAMDNYLRISGYVKTSMFINVFSNVATIGLLIVFLLVLEMDVVGSALAACIAMCGCSVAALIPFLRKKTLLKFVKPKFSGEMLRRIVSCGAPTFLNNIAGRVTSVLMNVSLMTLGARALGVGGGTTAVAAYSVLMYASELCQPLLYGMSDSLAPALGFNWGAENYRRVRKIAKCNYLGGCIVSVAATAILFFGAEFVAALFVDAGEAQLLTLATHALKLFCLTYLVRWFPMTTQSFLSAIGKPLHATALSVCVALVFPALLLGGLWSFGLDGIWLNMFGTAVLSSILGLFLLGKIRETRKSAE